ncbi:NAD-dependent epimerase/dehydratase family protein [Schinkia azotoformans]|uniref:NAD-dependent epimerase/dehydratase family protein n=1 Tax=Schinkia azotoformans TaxID=1454 RepID=UPI002DB96F8F|nr:NAD(P)-dependent oxidoreductase [Schinkia azotoformans]MEC1715787.1 NAD(P)-dependent oxidoreductase [Schinkia azotoformans]MEC1741426.1 NAD(P)-dependent oxidoreductase [Schinkia azotoformans]MEC1744420.1 NAD(P)-dependent oxidoreductase [Schinkia azotoformans]MEC1758589.1 NAD(P)-dependent oxidoreductase [Schinkia azotoformans]MEC1765391.1 NAD(P)-dependent oxidoreductase [Schinkia azotoformans]
MKKAMVIGSLGFIGFSLSKRLLEEEFEVIGIDHFSEKHDQLKEQKLLEIARNSNLIYINNPIENLILKEVAESCDVLYYCLHDSDINKNNINKKMTKMKDILTKVMDYCNEIMCKFVYLSSYESLNQRNPIGQMKMEEEYEIENYSKLNKNFFFHIVQLPTVYGPWQPDSMTFQQLIMGKDSPSIDPIREDAIFVEDLVEILLELPADLDVNKIIKINSNRKNQWQEGVNLIKGTSNPKQESSELEVKNAKDQEVYHRHLQTTLEEGIRRQKEHYKYLQKLKGLGLI